MGCNDLGSVGMAAEMQLNEIIKDILDRREAIFAQYKRGVANPYALPCKYIIMLPPELAKNYQKSWLYSGKFTKVHL